MFRKHLLLTLVLALGVGMVSPTVTFPADAQAGRQMPWYSLDPQRNVRLYLYLFYSQRCPHCQDALRFVDRLEKTYGWLEVVRYETSANPQNLRFYQTMAKSIGRVAGQVPAFFFCKQLEIGYDSYERNGRRIERSLVQCQESLSRQVRPAGTTESRIDFPGLFLALALAQPPGNPSRELQLEEIQLELPPPDTTVSVPWWGEVEESRLSLPLLTVVLAGCDAFNPCAFFVLLFLLSLMVHARSRARMLIVGGIFVFASGLVYFGFMAAWLNLFLISGHLTFITTTAGLVAVAIALVNIKDFFWFKQGPSLSIPESAKPGLFHRMTLLIAEKRLPVMLAGTIALAGLTNLYELLCTSGFPMVYTRVLTLRNLPLADHYAYLALYNVIYVIPLALIVLVFTYTLGSRKLTEHEGRALKLVGGIMMLMLGGLLVFRPEWLNSLWAALGIVSLSVLLTVVIVGTERFRRRGEGEFAGRRPSARQAG